MPELTFDNSAKIHHKITHDMHAQQLNSIAQSSMQKFYIHPRFKVVRLKKMRRKRDNTHIIARYFLTCLLCYSTWRVAATSSCPAKQACPNLARSCGAVGSECTIACTSQTDCDHTKLSL